MKFIHLSDLHIGKRVNDVSMLDDQQFILNRILGIIDTEQPDAVLIAGDVYDKSVPSAEAVTVFDSFLVRLAERGLPALIISGNHDSPERLAFGNRLFRQSSIHISPTYDAPGSDGTVESVTLHDEFGAVNFYLLPFLKPIHVRRFFPGTEIESYTDACRAVVERMGIDPTQRNVLLAHQFVTGAATCDSEEISVGGSDNVDAAVFDGFDYVALGHLHGPQYIGEPRIRYCGSPLKYSFSEASHDKSVTVAELGQKGELTLHTVPLVPRHDMRVLRGSFAELTDKAFYDTQVRDDYLHFVLTDEEDVPEVMGRLREIYPNTMTLSYDNTRTRTTQLTGMAEDVERKSELQLFEELYEKQNNRPMSDEQRAFALDLIEKIREEQA